MNTHGFPRSKSVANQLAIQQDMFSAQTIRSGQCNGSTVAFFIENHNIKLQWRSLLAAISSLVTLVVICCIGLAQAAPRLPKPRDGLNCTNHVEVIDRCSSLSTYSFTTPFNPFPRNVDEFKKSCDRISDGLKCLKVQGKCLGSVARRSLQSFQNSRQRHSKRLCANAESESAKRFQQTFACLDKFKKAEYTQSEREIISSVQVITIANMKWKDRFNHACCAAAEYKDKALVDIGPQCTQYGTVAEEMFDSVVGELLETACPEAKRLKEICASMPKLVLPKGKWKPVSLTGAALDLIVVLADTSTPDD